jgi:acyl-CoA thioesterase
MSGEFETATAVRRRDDGAYDATIEPGWDIGGNANGGYLIAIAARAMADAVDRPPLSLTAHYLSPGKVGPCVIAVDVLRAGRRMATAAGRLAAGGTDLLALVGTFGEQASGSDGPSVIDAAPPDLPPIEECIRGGPPPGAGESGFGDRVHARYRPADVGFRDGSPSGRAEMAGWFEFSDYHPVDAFGLLLATDAFAPVCFNRPEFPMSWAPTLELTVHVRGVPSPGPLRCLFRSRFMRSGMFEEDGELWDSSGALVAQSRQLALIPRG